MLSKSVFCVCVRSGVDPPLLGFKYAVNVCCGFGLIYRLFCVALRGGM